MITTLSATIAMEATFAFVILDIGEAGITATTSMNVITEDPAYAVPTHIVKTILVDIGAYAIITTMEMDILAVTVLRIVAAAAAAATAATAAGADVTEITESSATAELLTSTFKVGACQQQQHLERCE